ncbi:hypothetical protein B0G71_1436 [Paraburkholderia sp. BL27I4N3]|uniref:phage late control D family protein n=1 Tax=Paraburkholderia sp. BL27I4N3 TaxID=1938805 RepID=UPI000E289354|nr:contractile injection system protein, VgrG/Pvc8 family [Paraburkholderia sp. BL27I4N3]REE18420.1 hypothetical protein B0G71_1436 [Paraburkholderia sp. BL27I4N3]
MDLAAVSERNGAFYAPAFRIAVDGKPLIQTLAIGVSQVEVDLSLSAAGRFSFTVIDTFDMKQRAFLSGYGEPVLDILRFGARVEIAMGYGQLSSLTTLISGIVTEVTTSFPDSGTPELSVAGFDDLFALTLGKRARSWKNARDSDVVSAIASEYTLRASVSDTTEKHAQTEQNQESDLEFIKKLAERNHYEFYVDTQRMLHFALPSDRKDGILNLNWGAGLLNFKPEANLAAQVSKVQVYGWDPDNKRAFVGQAQAGEESGHDPRRLSGGERLRGALNRDVVLQLRQPVFTEAEARQRALAVLDDHAKQFVTGEAECFGVPDLLPDTNVTLGNLGNPFSKTYYVQQATHKVDSGGYRTRLKVKETSL